MEKYSILMCIIATVVFSEVFASQPGPCRNLSQRYAPSKIKGKMVHRSLYLDIFSKRKTTVKPLSICLREIFPPTRLKNYTVIGTDNKNFVVLYKCEYNPISQSNTESVNTYTKWKIPAAATLKRISQAYKKNGLQESKVLLLCQL
ncbi:uncharacterized protein LOC27207001 [Drosophila simulans]|uniref:Uncharacterized protein, isoform B n=1 Tax=Drosophila simulans TaxID=7240 RepID=A0A0J9RV02_DROSI|nr:uncharacterized protein LOC27207001 [Drosophila simulans]KMY99591.1 uncharacterized protein Dsimw501_GD27151, isoform B [Drosophila simulans]